MIFLSIIFQILMVSAGQNTPFQNYQWHNRILIIVGEDENKVDQQSQPFLNTEEAFWERDLLLVTVIDETVRVNGETSQDLDAKMIKDYFNLAENDFRVLLIGKDGGIKLSEDDYVSNERIYNLIDSMPMRKAEMRREKDNY